MSTTANPSDRPATWRSVVAVAEFRALWAAHTLSLLGDTLARVALALLVYRQTSSALWTAAVYAVTFVPWLVGGPVLSGLADRYPRRAVMVASSLGSASLAALLAVPGMPLLALCALLFVLVLLEAPFRAARAAALVDALPGDRYVLGSTVLNLSGQLTQLLGFAAGGVVVVAVGSTTALLLDAGTFAAAAGLVWRYTPWRPTAATAQDGTGGPPRSGAGRGVGGSVPGRWRRRIGEGAAVVFRDPQLRQLVLLAWLAAFWVVPEGLAAPYADALGGGGTAVGLLLAAAPAGTVLGSLVLTRLVAPARRRGLLVPLAAVSGVSMLLCASGPSLPVVLVLLMVSGVGCSYQLVANAMFMQTVPAGHRAEAFGLVSTGLYVGQGLGVLAAGAAADQLAPHVVVAIAGGLGLVLLAGAVGRPTPAGESVGSRYGEAPRRSRAAAGDAGTVPAAPLVSRPSG